MNKRHIQRFAELQSQLEAIENTKYEERIEYLGNALVDSVDFELLSEWKVKVKNLLINACGANSEHYNAFSQAENPHQMETSYDYFLRLRPIFRAAKEDYEGGYLTSVRSLVQAEVFDSVLEQASELLGAGYHVAAAVIAGVALETALRELCDRSSITHGMMDKMNNDLAKAGVYNKNQQKRITALAGIRNSAAHGQQDQFTREDVKSMIQQVEQFLAQNMAE